MEQVENSQVKTKRDLLKERMSGKYPDKNFDDDEVFAGQISDDYDNYDKEIAGYKEREGQFSDMFTSDARSAAFLMNWKNGADPVVELIRQFGSDIADAINDPERMEAIAEAGKEFTERVAKNKELEAEYEKNLKGTLSMIEQLKADKGYNDDQIDEAMSFLSSIVYDGIVGKYTAESIEMAMKALNHDADVATAGHEGEVRGKNTKIDEKLRKRTAGDGTPSLAGKNDVPNRQEAKRRTVFDLAEAAS